MAFNLIETVKGYFTPHLISTTAASLGESEGGIQKALSGTIPSVLAGLIDKAADPGAAAGILAAAGQAANSGILDNPAAVLGNNDSLLSQAAEMLKTVLGNKVGDITSFISNFAGIKQAAAASVLNMVAPLALGALGKHASDNNINAGNLMSFLGGQKNAVMNALPPGLGSIAGLTANGLVSHVVSASATAKTTGGVHGAAHQENAAGETSGRIKFMTPLILGILAVALSIYLFRGCGNAVNDEPALTDTTNQITDAEPAPAATAVVNTERELLKVKLPNNTVIDAYKGGIEDKLVSFLGTDYKKLGEDSLKNVWFDFDNLNFETGSAVITAESQKQVDNLAVILQAFPAVKLKIGGYTDKVGDEAANKKLSEARARSVQAALSKAGVGKQITGAEGYGSNYARYAADAPESDRVKDRHVSVSIR